MVERNYNGWIEIDAKGTLKYWDKARLNYGMAIDVFDENEDQIDAKEFFTLQSCEAGKSVVPFALINTNNKQRNIYREKSKQKCDIRNIPTLCTYKNSAHQIYVETIKFL